jgi:hypothetical protein
MPPAWEYPHPEGCSITGGYVYRDKHFPQMQGVYFYADFRSCRIYALRQNGTDAWQSQPLLDSGLNIAPFGEDETGELYVLDLDGDVFHLIANE